MQEQRILTFANSIDTVNDDAFEKFKAAVNDYLKTQLHVAFFQVLVDGARVVGQPALSTYWISVDQQRDTHPLWTDGDKYFSQRSVCYIHGRPLWISSKADVTTPLKDLADDEIDVSTWGINTDGSDFDVIRKKLPAYQDYGAGDSRTSIIMPLRFGHDNSRVFGVINLEFDEKYTKDNQKTDRLEKLIEAISRVIWLRETTRAQNIGTSNAAQALQQRLTEEAVVGGFNKPTVFFAFAQNADKKVCDAIKSLVNDDFGDQVRLYSWDDDNQSGAIDQHLVQQITASSYAICYFSQPMKRGSKRFCDNPNVLIEAGMLHALYGNSDTDPRRWLPIRESTDRTSSIPFDFISQRFLHVPRNKNDQLDKAAFINDLRARLEAFWN